MRKLIVFGLAAAVVVSLAAAGVPGADAQGYRFVRIVGGTPEGSWGITGSKLAELINRGVKGVTASNSPAVIATESIEDPP